MLLISNIRCDLGHNRRRTQINRRCLGASAKCRGRRTGRRSNERNCALSDARRGQGKHRSERSTATNTGKHRALGTTSGTSRRGGAVVAFAGLVGTPTAIAAPAALVAGAHVGVSVAGVTPTALNDIVVDVEGGRLLDAHVGDLESRRRVVLVVVVVVVEEVGLPGDAVSTLNVPGGKYEVVSGQIKFTPDAGFAGAAAAVTYRVANETGATATATVQVTVASAYPHATNDSATTAYETAVSVDVLANDDSGAPSLTMNASSLTLLNSSGQAVSTLTVNGGTYSVEAGKIKFTRTPASSVRPTR
ncbi:MAG: hypothetical protein LKG20_02535 [Tetrasphaera jenkinsii]|jgi:hypothetical protein|nr:hypothetical protein [Tetrasphaera jenkinsii]